MAVRAGENPSTKAPIQHKESSETIQDDLFDISKSDIKQKLCVEDYNFIVNQQGDRKFTFGNTDKNLQRRLLRKRSREDAEQQRATRSSKEMNIMKEIVTGPLEGISSSSETDSTESELQLQPIIATTSQQDFVRLNVPKRIAAASQVVAAADRHRISSNALNDILAAFIRESDGDVNDFILSKASTLRGRKEVRELEFNKIKQNFKSTIIGEFFTIHWDEKLLKQYGDMKQTPHIAVLSSNGSDPKLLGTTSLVRGTGLQQAQAIKNMLDAWKITEMCVAMCFDTTAANSGKFSGACVLLEALLGRSLLWIACRYHIFEVVLSQVCKGIFEDSAGPSVELFQHLKNNW